MSKCEICQREMEKEQAQYVSGKLICKECADIEETKKTREKEEYENGILRDTGLTRKQVNEYLGTSDSTSDYYYLKKWERAKNPEKFAGLNWVALIFTELWMGYRKFYISLLVYFVVQIAFLLIVAIGHFSGMTGSLIGLAPNICLRLWAFLKGNAACYRRMLKKIGTEERGSSWAAVIVIIVIRIILNLIQR